MALYPSTSLHPSAGQYPNVSPNPYPSTTLYPSTSLFPSSVSGGQTASGSQSATGTASGHIVLTKSQTASGSAAGAPHGLSHGDQTATGTVSGSIATLLTASQSASAGTVAKLALNPRQVAVGTVAGAQGRTVSQTAVGIASAVNTHDQSVSLTATGSAYGIVVVPTLASQSATTAIYTELYYAAQPVPLDEQPLAKLADFTVSTSAVHTDPSIGAGSATSVSATFTAGYRPDSALGTEVSFRNGAIGEWSGEVTKLKSVDGSSKVSISVDTPMVKLSNEQLLLFPHIPAAASTSTAGEAVDYWTQQCGVFYDGVDGDVRFYQSGYGHPYAFGADLGSTKLYEKSYTPVYRTGRTALAFPSATSQCAMFEDTTARVPVSVSSGRKLIASTAVTSGAVGSVKFVFDDGNSLSLSFGSGSVSALCGPQTLASVPLSGEARAWVSLENVDSGYAVRLTSSSGGDSGVVLTALPIKAYCKLLRAEFQGSAGGRYGTYLAVADAHPSDVPPVQKDLGATKKSLAFVPGFGTSQSVWDKLNEFCSVNRLDLSYQNQMVTLRPRSSDLVFPSTFARLERNWERKLKYRQVAVVDYKSKPCNTGDGLLYRADTVLSVKRGEVQETTVQTKHSILSLKNPLCVTGIEPFPYKGGNGATGQYVVTGADGYIVSPQWWADNGGKVEVFLTPNDGEIKIRVTAPWPDSVRAPYRISEGADDRPALYIVGSGVINDPVQRNIPTGAASSRAVPQARSRHTSMVSQKPGIVTTAKHAREGYEKVFDSPFCGTPDQVYAAAMGMASEYSAASAQYDFEIDNDWDTATGLGQFPAGAVFPDAFRNVRVLDAQQTAKGVTGTAEAHTTIGMAKAARPSGAKIGDRIRDRTLRETAIYPLERSN